MLHVIQSGDRGGGQRHVRDLATRQRTPVAGLVAGSTGWLTEQAGGAGISVRVAPSLTRSLDPRRVPSAAREIAAVADARDATILHAHGIFAFLACARAGLAQPLVYTPHGLQWRDPARGPGLRLLSLALHRRLAPRVAALVAVSRQEAEDAVRSGFSRDVIHHIPNGVAVPEQVATARDANVIGVLTRLVPGKGLFQALRVLGRLPNATLVVGGDGPLGPRLRAAAERDGVADRVRWLGWVDDLDAFYDSIGVYLSLSRKEGLPYALLDAMARGVPVVVSDIPAHRELVEPGRTGWLVDAAEFGAAVDVIGSLTAETTDAARLGSAERERILGDYALSTMAAAHDDVYGNLGRARPRPGA